MGRLHISFMRHVAIVLGGNCPWANCLGGNCPRWQLSGGNFLGEDWPRTEQDNPPGELPPRAIAPWAIAPQTIAPQTISTWENCPRTIPSYDDWNFGQITPGNLSPRTILIMVIASRRLCCLKNFYCLSFRLCHNEININMHFFKTYDRFPLTIISERGWWRLFFGMGILISSILIWACPKFNFQ